MSIIFSVKLSFQKCCYETPAISVYENFSYRWLTLDSDTIQTIINKKKPQKAIMPYLKALTLLTDPKDNHIALLGLGGGAVLHYIEPILENTIIDVVELNQEVIDVAMTYFYVDKLPFVKMHHQNAVDFATKTASETYKNLWLDVYQSHAYPDECLTPEFFTEIHRILKNDGLLAMNLPDSNLLRLILSQLRAAFKTTPVTIPIKGYDNQVILVMKSEQQETLVDRMRLTQSIKKLIWDPVFGVIAKIGHL